MSQSESEIADRILRPPDLTLKAVLSSDAGNKALISQKAGRGSRNFDQRVVQEGDLIRVAGVEWTILDIDQVSRSVVLKNEVSGVAHVVAVDP